MRTAARKDNAKDTIVKALRDAGAYVYDLKQPVDLLVGFVGVTILVEVKTPGGDLAKKLTPLQRKFAAEWPGGNLWIVSTPEEALSALEQSI